MNDRQETVEDPTIVQGNGDVATAPRPTHGNEPPPSAPPKCTVGWA